MSEVETARRVSVAMFDVLWGLVLHDGTRPAVLSTGSPGRTSDERVAVVNDATARLRAAGIVGPLGVAPEAVAVLTTTCRPWVAVDVRLFERVAVDQRHPHGVRQVRARISVAGSVGAAVALDAAEVLMWSFPPSSLITEAVAMFGAHEAPRRFPGLTVRPDEFPDLLRRAAYDPVLRQLSGPYVRRAHAVAVARGQVVGRRRVSTSLLVNDTEAGRFLVYPDRNLLVVAPGNRTTLERKLRTMTEFR